MPWHELLFYNLFLLSLMILATRLATCLHEFLGHAFMALAFDGEVKGIRISLFGGGRTYYGLEEPGLPVRFLVSFGGIAVNWVSGILPFLLMDRLKRKPLWTLFFLLFGMVSLLGATAYTTLGFYYEQGDPVSWMREPPAGPGWLWMPFFVFSPFLSCFTMKTYAIFHEKLFPTRSLKGRFRILGMTLGLTLCLYILLYVLTDQRSAAVDSPALAFQRAEQEIRNTKKEALYQKLRRTHPDLSEERLKEMAEKTPIVVHPDEVPQKPPLKPAIAFVYLLGAFFGLRAVRGGMPDHPFRFRKRTIFLNAAFASALLAVIFWRDGWVFRAG
ncbi:MAG: M50 family metallopeptidase [Pseudomonadota bacterium]